MKTVYFVRHGQSEANISGLYGGDTALTEIGRQQADTIAASIQKLPHTIDTIISSDMVRAKQTADIIAERISFAAQDITRDGRLNELAVGKMAGTPETNESLTLREQWVLDPHNPMEVESLDSLVSRIEAFVADLKQQPNDTILVVGHGFSGRMFCRVLNDIERTRPLPQLTNAQEIEVYPNLDLPTDAERVML